jgi:hypothetical protein
VAADVTPEAMVALYQRWYTKVSRGLGNGMNTISGTENSVMAYLLVVLQYVDGAEDGAPEIHGLAW